MLKDVNVIEVNFFGEYFRIDMNTVDSFFYQHGVLYLVSKSDEMGLGDEYLTINAEDLPYGSRLRQEIIALNGMGPVEFVLIDIDEEMSTDIDQTKFPLFYEKIEFVSRETFSQHEANLVAAIDGMIAVDL